MSTFRKYKSVIVRKLLSPSMRFEISQTLAWIREQFDHARLWRWEITRLPQQSERPYHFLYVGRKKHRELAGIILGLENGIQTNHVNANQPSRRVLVSEMPVPGALR